MRDTECKKALSKKQNRLSEIAARDSKVKFTSLAYLLTKDFLRVWIPEPDERQRPLGIPVPEERIFWRWVAKISLCAASL
jgi:retron-type reverse transcriptase